MITFFTPHVRPSFPTLQNLAKENFTLRIVIATDRTVVLAEWINVSHMSCMSSNPLIDPLGQIGGHYFHTWCQSVRPETKNTRQY